MGLRFRILAALYLLVMLLTYDHTSGMVSDITGVFLGLGGLLILCVIALWPNDTGADRVDRDVDGTSWADRIDVEKIGRPGSRPES